MPFKINDNALVSNDAEVNKNRNKYFFALLLFFCLLDHQCAFSQDSTSFKNKILGHWINYFGYRQDTIVYIPFNSPLAERVSPELRYSGIVFEEGDNYLHLRWKWCGNDDRADSYPGKWRSDKLNNRDILTMIGNDNRTKNYNIIALDSDIIVLVPRE